MLPEYLKKYFWDSDFKKIDFVKHKNYVLGRVLLYGDLQAIRFILENVKKSEVEEYLERKGEYVLDKKSRLFWNKLIESNDIWKYGT